MMIRGHSLHKSYPIRNPGPPTCHVELWIQPAHRWLIARLYHRYDMLCPRLPGARLIDRWTYRWKRWRQGTDLVVPWLNEQDCRCDYLTRRGRVTLATIQLDDAVYEQVARRVQSTP